MEQIDTLIEKFEAKRDTHPELATLWSHYLQIKKTRFENLLEQGTKMLDTLETCEDVPIQIMAILCVLKAQMDNNNT